MKLKFQKGRNRFIQLRGNNRGIALVMAMVTMTLLMYIANEVAYEATVEYVVNSQSVNKVKAYYAARSAVDLALLRIKLYEQVKSQLGSMAQGQSKNLDLIWSFPFAWPPPIPPDLNEVDKDLVNETVKESKMDSSYMVNITDEGSKLDLGDLASKSKAIREGTQSRLLNLFEYKIKNDEDWARQNQDLNYSELVNNMIDWVDADTTSLNGGDEARYYPSGENLLPPHRNFRTVEELRLVAGMTDAAFKLIEPIVTVYSTRAINPNYASEESFQSMDASMTPEVIKEIIKRRGGSGPGEGFFQSADEFWDFVNRSGGSVSKQVIDQTPLVFDGVTNFRIRAIGQFAKSTREIEAVVFDMAKAAQRISAALKKEKGGAGGGTTPPDDKGPGTGGGSDTTKPGDKKQQTVSKGPPRIVYWNER